MIYNIMDSQALYHALVNRGISEEQLEKEIAQKSEEYNGYISKEGILFLLAKEHGILIIDKEKGEEAEEAYQKEEQEIDYDEFIIPLKDLQEGMDNIAVIGRIEKIYGIREFTRKDSSSGKVGSFLLNDGTQMLKVNLWDAQTTIMEQEYFKEQELLRLMGCYTKKNLKTEELELYSSKKTIVHLAPADIELKRFPHLKGLLTHSSQIYKENKSKIISVSGIVEKIFYLREKENPQGERIFILRFVIHDKSVSYAVNVFGMKAVEILKQIAEGKTVSLEKMVLKNNSYTHQEELYFAKNSTFFIL